MSDVVDLAAHRRIAALERRVRQLEAQVALWIEKWNAAENEWVGELLRRQALERELERLRR